MRATVRHLIIILAVLAVSVWAIIPPSKRLALGRDLRGGFSLVYSVLIKPTDPPDVIERVIDVLKQRIDPNGLAEIQIAKQGRDRIEISMPLPNSSVKALREAYLAELNKISGSRLDTSQFERLMRLPDAQRDAEIVRLTAGNSERTELIRKAATAFSAIAPAREQLNNAQAELKAAKDANADAPRLEELTKKVDDAVVKTADAELAYDAARTAAVSGVLDPSDLRRALELSNEPRSLINSATKQRESRPSPRQEALTRLKATYKSYDAQIDAVVAAYNKYAAERATMDDPNDLKRLLAGAGVLDFRITVDPGSHPQESRLRRELAERGPRNVQSTDARWYRINKIDNWMDSSDDEEAIKSNAAGYFLGRYGLVAAEYNGDYYVLAWDTAGSRLTKLEGDWSVASAYQSSDSTTGLPAISFEMNPRGGVLLGELTKANVGKHMAVLLDDEIYTAPSLRSRISKSGQITGSFSDAELRYIIRVLAAGSLQAKLSPEPISESLLGPELGADNLRKGLTTGLIAFLIVTIFMVGYYFTCGFIAVIALAVNFLLVLAIMSLNHAAFTLPGIAGIVLTFGQAIDSNVLIYERMREEFLRGADMRTAVRLGFSRAFSSIVDGNVANLIICAVLYYFGTPEIRGFAITLGIGVVTTLFTALYVSKLIFTILVEHFNWGKASQLPMMFPIVQRLLTPHVDWMRLRWVTMGVLAVFLAASAVIWYQRGDKLLDTEFLGGTQIELKFRTDPATGKPITMTREVVQKRVQSMAAGDKVIEKLKEAEVLPVNPQNDGVTSNRFKIRIGATDEKAVLAALTHEFADAVESRGALVFTGSTQNQWKQAPVYSIVSKVLGENVDQPNLRDDVGAYVGGVAILLEKISPAVSKESLQTRLAEMRQRPEYSDTLSRKNEIRVLEGDDAQVTSAVLLIHDDTISLFQNQDRWTQEVAEREWKLALDALTHTTQIASVQTFSPTIADTFKAQAIVSIVLSMLLLTIYVWIRFGAGRWAVAATVPLFADVIGIVGLIAVAQILYESPATNKFAMAIGLAPFKIDLNQIAALLTITGYSLNDKIIILDRIRENKGKLQYASYQVINDSINQTLSRTIITAGTTLISTTILYFFGGEAVRGFAYVFTLGVIIGTYTSIVSSPLVWSRKADQSMEKEPQAGMGSGPIPSVGV